MSPDQRPPDHELAGVPGLGRLYVRGGTGTLRHAVGRALGRGLGELPEVRYVARGVRADPGLLTTYQHLIGEPAADTLPAGFVHALTFGVPMALMARGDFPLPLAGLVHLSNRVEQLRPVLLADSLEVHAHAERLRPHRSGTQVTLVTEVRVERADGVAWRGESTYLARGPRPGAGDPAPSADPQAMVRLDPTARLDPTGQLAPALVPTASWRLPADIGRQYAAVSGDWNPIHLSALTARAFGYPRAIAHGMYTAARALAGVGAARTSAFTWTVDFICAVRLPGVVAVRIARDDEGGGFTYAGWSPESGRTHFTGAVRPR